MFYYTLNESFLSRFAIKCFQSLCQLFLFLRFSQFFLFHIIIKQLLCHLRRPFCVCESLSSTIFSMSCLVNEANLAPTVQKVDSAIQWIVELVSLILIHWIEIYPMESAIQLLNNWGREVMFFSSLLTASNTKRANLT